jgi:hypothetical protein
MSAPTEMRKCACGSPTRPKPERPG